MNNRLLAVTLPVVTTVIALINITTVQIIPMMYPNEKLLFPQSMVEVPEDQTLSTLTTLYNSSPYLASIAWGIYFALVWKGQIRAIWQKHGYDSDTFNIISNMRGSPTRVQILEKLDVPKTRLQLAKELGLDWKTIDGHINTLMHYYLVEEFISVGTYKYLIISEKGKDVLRLLRDSVKLMNNNV